MPEAQSWRTVMVPFGQVLACALAVPAGFLASAMVSTIATLPLLLVKESMWVATLTLCLHALIDCAWVAGFARLAFVAHRRGARFSAFLCAALACGAIPYALIMLLCLLAVIFSDLLWLFFG
ncbi:MAG TPA: hypothetical protein VJ783_24200 [Pirellulales bacterium]|nr:hypothetical protein [Pirellulales bacterium]